MKEQTKNTILFVVLMVLCFGVWYVLRYWVFPPPPAPPATPPPQAHIEIKATPELAAMTVGFSDGGIDQFLWQTACLAGPPPAKEAKPEPKPVAPPPAVAEKPPTPLGQLKTKLGDKDRKSKFHLYAILDARGATVRQLIANKFQQADAEGRPVTEKDGSPTPLTLIPDDPANPSFQLLHFNVNDKDDDKPFDTLGKVDWTVQEDKGADAAGGGAEPQSITFVSPPVQGFQITKKYTLAPGEYHLGLEVTVQRVDNALDGKPIAFRYQLSGAHGLPVEGRWYTPYFRTSLIGQMKTDGSKHVERDYQDLRQVYASEGGNAVDRQQGYVIRYAGVAVQYFASVIAVDDKQEKQDYLLHARPTLERAVAKGVIKSVTPAADPNAESSFMLTRADNGKNETFRIRKGGKFLGLQEGASVAVIYTTGSFDGKEYPQYAQALGNKDDTQPVWEDDATVRVATEPKELKAGEEFTHKYLLYNGPVKVMLLGQPDRPEEAVAPALVGRYSEDLGLSTLTDAPSPSWIGGITGPTGIAWVLIWITNRMHWVLWFLHFYAYVPYILCIVCLTIMVRGAMFPVSRKQQMTSIRMQALAPELKKLQEKFKDDKQGMAAAQMELYRKHGVNPFGTCWLLALQMPIFMGLYYALQESIHFRLASLPWLPWWMPNLSAPDMLLWWSQYIPFISQPSWYGYPFYLGPYLNVLPIVAVAFMMVQQKWTMPPPTDDTQAQQQKMMKWMMVIMAVMFYKVASGLCIYFIASSLWGFMERQFFLPKKKLGAPAPEPGPEKPGLLARLLGPKPGNGSGAPSAPPSGKGKRGKRRQEAKARARDEGDDSMFRRLRDWWDDILEQARKK